MVTVQDVIDSRSNGSCSTGAVKGLSLQIIAEMNSLVQNALVNIDDLNIKFSDAVNPFLQPRAREALRRAIGARGNVTLNINSAYRTVAQQFILWSWYRQGKQCGISLAATPGLSNHEDGLAIDTSDYDAWRSALTTQGWNWLNGNDPFHFSYRGGGTRDDIGEIGLKAFQSLWNKHNPNDKIGVDGQFGPATAASLAKSPAEGFENAALPQRVAILPEEEEADVPPLTPPPRLLRLSDPLMEGDDVRSVQQALVRVGLFQPDQVDGVFGPRTEAAVREFQQERGLSADGIVGDSTRRELGIGISDVEEPHILAAPQTKDRWRKALANAPTTGASAVTARQDGLPPGIASSQKMAQTDLPQISAISSLFEQMGQEFDVPPALIAALASRESRAGKALDSKGFGDRGFAFGILQVDKRYHTLRGTNSPTSRDHIEQAVGIFADYRQQLQKKHPDWEDEYILKGAVAAYNSGVGNIQTKTGIDLGTTGNDYGSDVIARAKFYSTQPALA